MISSSNSNRRVLRFLPAFFLYVTIQAQPPLFKNFEYVENFSPLAVEQMLEYHIPASVIMAQAVMESGSGSSDLALRSNNHFGIKCHIEWAGDTIAKDDDTLAECFRRYNSVEESYIDHSLFLVSRARYNSLFELELHDYAAWCHGLKAAGYATSDTYAEELISIIENFKLYRLDGPVLLASKTFVLPETELKLPVFYAEDQYLSEFANSNMLFTDEMDIHLRSLQFLSQQAGNEDGEE